MMNTKPGLTFAGIGFLASGLLVLFALTLWWLSSGHWVGLSTIDGIALVDPHAAAMAIQLLSNSDMLYFIFAELPLYGMLFIIGIILLAMSRFAMRGRRSKTLA